MADFAYSGSIPIPILNSLIDGKNPLSSAPFEPEIGYKNGNRVLRGNFDYAQKLFPVCITVFASANPVSIELTLTSEGQVPPGLEERLGFMGFYRGTFKEICKNEKLLEKLLKPVLSPG